MASKQSIEAGRGHVSLGVDENPLKAGLKAAEQTFKDWGKSIGAIGASVGAVGASITAPFLQGLSTFADWGREMRNGMRETGIGFDALDMIIDGMRVGLDELVPATAKMSAFLSSAREGAAGAVSTMNTLGLSISELAAMDQGDRMMAFADALSRVSDAGQRIALQREIFGRGGLSLNIEGGAAGIRARAARTDFVEGVLSESDLNMAKEYNKVVGEMKLATAGFWRTLGAVAAGPMKEVYTQIVGYIIQARQWIEANRELLGVVFRVGLALVGIGMALGVVTVGCYGLAFVVGKLAVVGAVVMAAFSWIPTLLVWSDYIKYSLLGVTGVLRMFGVRVGEIAGPLSVLDDMFDSLFNLVAGFASGTIFAQIGESLRRMWGELLASPIGEFAQDIALIVVGVVAVTAALAGAAVYVAYFITANWIGVWVDAIRYLTPMVEQLFSLWVEGMTMIGRVYQTLLAPLINLGRAVMDVISQVYSAAVTAFASAWATTVQEFGRLTMGLSNTAQTAWRGILAAFRVGDWTSLWEIFQAAVRVAFAQLSGFAELTFNAWSDAFVNAFQDAISILRAAFNTMWGDVLASAYRTLAEVYRRAAESPLAIGPIGARFREQQQEMENLAMYSEVNARSVNAQSAEADWWDRQLREVLSGFRDDAARAGNDAEVSRLNRELDGAMNRQIDRQWIAELDAMMGGGSGDSSRSPTGGFADAVRSMVMGGFGANAMLILGGSSATPEMRAARAAERSAALLAEAVAALIALREEVAPRFA